MTPTSEATILDAHGRTALRFERVLRHPPARVWRALTDRGEQAAWHPTPFEFEDRAGGAVSYPGEHGPQMPEGEVTEYDPPRVLAHTWGDDLLRWELTPHDDGCLLVLVHTFDDHFKAARDAAGWHVCLDALSGALEGAGGRMGMDDPSAPGPWHELNSAYEQRFGIPHEKATPPPTG